MDRSRLEEFGKLGAQICSDPAEVASNCKEILVFHFFYLSTKMDFCWRQCFQIVLMCFQLSLKNQDWLSLFLRFRQNWN